MLLVGQEEGADITMPRIRGGRILTCYFVLFVMSLACWETSYAQEKHERTGWWAAVEAGAGIVELPFPGKDGSDILPYFAVTGGYALTPNVLVGIEVSGWLYDSNDDIYMAEAEGIEGDGLSQVFLTSRLYPVKGKNAFIRIGGGHVSHAVHEYGSANRREGWGLHVGGGYDVAVGKKWSLTPFCNYNYGEAKDRTSSAFTVGVGVTWH
jgi:hypothetical protein